MALPPRIEKPSMGRQKRVRSDAHLRWVREHRCCVPGCDHIAIQAAHVRDGTDGGMGMKPGDNWTISLCGPELGWEGHHAEQHRIGEAAFERRYGIDMKALAREFSAKSPHRKKLEQRQ